MWRKLLFFLFGIGFAFRINFVGSVSYSELFLIVASPFYLLKINWKQKSLFLILVLYGSLFASQVLSELIIGNAFSAASKGLAITIVSFLHFAFLYHYFQKDLSLLPVLILSLAVSQLLVGPEEILKGESFSINEITESMGSILLKFYIAPVLINLLLFASIIIKTDKHSYLLILVSLFFIVLGARSSGFTLLLTGLVSLVVGLRPTYFERKNLLKGFSLISIFGYCLYCIYVTLVITGTLETGNSNQLLRCYHPYNPFELLLRGRSEVWVGWQAFMDSFFFGHGAWAYDYSGHYLRLMAKVQHLDPSQIVVDENAYLIPSHSVLVGAGMTNGILAFVSMLAISLFFIEKGIVDYSKIPQRYRIVFISFLISMLWTVLFSPPSHFRLTLPVYFAVIFVLNRKFTKRNRVLNL